MHARYYQPVDEPDNVMRYLVIAVLLHLAVLIAPNGNDRLCPHGARTPALNLAGDHHSGVYYRKVPAYKLP